MKPESHMLDQMLEAARLTREGRLQEATALIQRTLNHGATEAAGSPARAGESANDADVIDVDGVEVAESAVRGAAVLDAPPPQPAAPAPAGGHFDTKSLFQRLRAKFMPDVAPEPVARAPHVPQPDQPEPDQPVIDQPEPGVRAPDTVIDGGTGEFIAGSFSHRAGTRPYKLFIPAVHAGEPRPLVVMLHGCTQSPDDFATGTRMNQLAAQQGFLVLYPAQTRAANHTGCWNWFKREDQGRDNGEPALLAAMTRDVMARYDVDPRRVYVAGLSAGGAMAAVLAVRHPELYAAVGIHSGLPVGAAHDLPSALGVMKGMPTPPGGAGTVGAAIPAIVFHGDSDKVVHPRNGERVVGDALAHGTAEAGAQTERGTAPRGGHDYSRTVHRDANGRPVLESWVVHGGGHAWFGGSHAGTYTDPRGPDASEEMLRFFREAR